MLNPLEDYLQTKTASQMSFGGMGGIGEGLVRGAKAAFKPEVVGGAVAGAAVAGAGAGLVAAASKVMSAITKKKDFEAMLESAPDLRDFHTENPEQFNRHYSSFRSMNPTFAKDPVVSASYMRQMSEYPATAGSVIVQSLQALPKGRGMDVKLDRNGPSVSFKR